MTIELMAIIGLTVLIFIVFLMVNLKDGETNTKLSRYERIIEDLSRQNHKFKKELERLTSQKRQMEIELEEKMSRNIKEQVQLSVQPMVASMREIEEIMQAFQDEQVQRIDRIEERSNKDVSYLPSQAAASNEKIIIAQYSQGKSEAAIAKDLRIGIGEVDLVLKLANLK